MVRFSRTFAVTAAIAMTATPALAQSARAGRTKSGIAYDIQGDGPIVVLITGSNLDRRMWTYEAEWLKKTAHTVVRYDLRAHGTSDTATKPFSHVDDLFSVLDDIGADTATLIGLSAGSTIALDAALQAATRVDRLVLVGPSISGYISKAPAAFTADLVAALRKDDYTRASEVLLRSSVFALAGESENLVRQMVMENNRLWSVPRELMRQNDRPALTRLSDVAIPTLILLGEHDLLQRQEAELLAQGVRRARLVIIRGGGHLLNLTSPAEFRAEVSRFIE